jgi:hypothetical protein
MVRVEAMGKVVMLVEEVASHNPTRVMSADIVSNKVFSSKAREVCGSTLLWLFLSMGISALIYHTIKYMKIWIFNRFCTIIIVVLGWI